jgi:hypothetical protein
MDAFEGGAQRGRIEAVPPYNLGRGPDAPAQRPGPPRETAHGNAPRFERRDETPSNIAAGAGNQDKPGRG